MSQIPNPNHGKPFDRVLRDISGQGVWGIRNEHTPEEEIVHIPTGKSNQEFFIPDQVTNPEGCKHDFWLTDTSKREVECQNHGCGIGFIFHPLDLTEKDGKLTVKYHKKFYKVKVP